MILFVAGLMASPTSHIESATIDGASGWQVFWRIKWPLLSPTMLYMDHHPGDLRRRAAFVPIKILTRGGRARPPQPLAIIYVFGFEFFTWASPAPPAIFTAAVFLILTFVMMKGMGGYGYYETTALRGFALHAALVALVVVNIFPVLWMLSSAFTLPTELFTRRFG